MKVFFLVVFAVVVPTMSAQVQTTFDPQVETMGMCPACSSDGRTWRALGTEGAKVIYIGGVQEALAFLEGIFLRGTYFPPSLSVDEMISAVDRFYEQPENLPIPIMQAFRMVTLKANGSDPAPLERELAKLRRDALDLRQKMQQNKK